MPRKKAAPTSQVTCPKCGHAADPAAGPPNFCPECGAALRAAADETSSSALLGKVVADRYRLLALLGEGGMGSVFKAEHIRMGKALALKILRGDFAEEEGAVERFRAEARIVSRLSHPHTIAVFDFGEIEGGAGFYLAMEYVPGKDLARVLRDGGRLPEARAVAVGEQLLGSLAEAHEAGIVHRDVKPGNVVLTQTRSGEDFVKVLDFGIAKLRDEAGAAAASTTSSGAIVGTPSYLAPEQARGEPLDGRADLYAVGCLLYELVAGRPPFQAPSPMAVVSAHLHQAPPPLAEQAPGISRRFAEVVHRALAKAPADRFASADEMRDALLALAEPTGPGRSRRSTAPNVTGELEIASREDFRDFERQVRALRRSRVVAPLSALLALVALSAAAWRWDDVYGAAAARAPALAALLPAALRPSGHYDGSEHEPNDVPPRANPLPIPKGPDGRAAGGAAVIRGHVGAKLSDTSGDVDLFRLEVPPAPGRRVLVVDWRAEREGEGIRGLDVALALNRERQGGGRTSAPLVASVNRGGPGRPERLVAAVEGGVYYLAVREQHEDATGPVEKPTDRYVLSVKLAEPPPGEEVEPNDAPERVEARHVRYVEWRALAARNPLAEGIVVHGETALDDPDAYAVEARPAAAGEGLVVAVPTPGLALAARLWSPDAEDLGAPRPQDRVRFREAGTGSPGAPLVLRPEGAPGEGGPALLELRAAEGAGRYDVVALGDGAASAEAVLALFGRLGEAGRTAPALEIAAAWAGARPRAARRSEVLLAAGKVAAEAAGRLDAAGVSAYERAGQLLGNALFRLEGGRVHYGGAFEAAVEGAGRAADEAALRLVPLAAPCTPEDVAARAEAFLARRPAPDPDLAADARLVRARALEGAFWAGRGKDRARRDAALAAWRALAAAGGPAAGEAVLRVAALGAKEPSREGARDVCR